MPTGKYLKDEEKVRILHLFDHKLINKSHVTVKKYLNCPSGYGKNENHKT